MKVKEKESVTTIFGNLDCGDVFMLRGSSRYAMKMNLIPLSPSEKYNMVWLNDGVPGFLKSSEDIVFCSDATLFPGGEP